MMTEKEILVKARELIEKPETWTQYFSARDAIGNVVNSTSDEAVSFCPTRRAGQGLWWKLL